MREKFSGACRGTCCLEQRPEAPLNHSLVYHFPWHCKPLESREEQSHKHLRQELLLSARRCCAPVRTRLRCWFMLPHWRPRLERWYAEEASHVKIFLWRTHPVPRCVLFSLTCENAASPWLLLLLLFSSCRNCFASKSKDFCSVHWACAVGMLANVILGKRNARRPGFLLKIG